MDSARLKATVVRACIDATVAAWRDFETWLGVGSDRAPLRRDDMQSMPENMMQISLGKRLYSVVRDAAYVSLEEQVEKRIAPAGEKGGRKVDVVGWNLEQQPIFLIEAKRGAADAALGRQLTDLVACCAPCLRCRSSSE